MDATQIKSTGSPTAATQAPESGKNSELGKDQFLKLFVAQLQHQDPMNPMQDSDFMGQMASFSTLEQVTNLAEATNLSQTVGLIGRTVTYKDSENVTHTGVVEKVNHTKDGTVLTIDGTAGVDPSAITEIAQTKE
jgi:flagellar basal-body rod modification protein FlgD